MLIYLSEISEVQNQPASVHHRISCEKIQRTQPAMSYDPELL